MVKPQSGGESINREVKLHELKVNSNQWVYAPLADFTWAWILLFNKTYFNGQLPSPALSIDRGRYWSLGHFRIDRNRHGLLHEVNLNTRYLPGMTVVELLKVILHEMTHLWENICGKTPKSITNNYHGKFFRDFMYELGLPTTDRGVTTITDGPFVRLVREYGINECIHLDFGTSGKRPPAESKTRKWRCRCTTIWTARGTQVTAECSTCGEKYRPLEKE